MSDDPPPGSKNLVESEKKRRKVALALANPFFVVRMGSSPDALAQFGLSLVRL
jgi:hypothetical protein